MTPDSYLSAHGSYLGFIHAGLRDDISQRTSGQVLHHHPQLVTHQVTMETINRRRYLLFTIRRETLTFHLKLKGPEGTRY